MLRLRLVPIFLIGMPLVFGCSGKSSPKTDSTSGITAANSTNLSEYVRPDFSIPRFEPKPLIWVDDWQFAELPEARKRASDLTSTADRLKAAEEYAAAEKYYRQAMEADPTWAYPAYQLACNYELSNQHTQAEAQFAAAVELGFDDFPTALIDGELGQIRESPNFVTTLLRVRERYLVTSKTRVGQPIAVRASGTKPDKGWPVMLILHGFGDTNLSYLDESERWSEGGFVAVTVPGSVPSTSGTYQWATDSTEPTDQDLQAIITSPLFEGMIDREKVFLLGFSQGAFHALTLTAENPNRYAGVVAISPGSLDRLATPRLNRLQRPARCVFIHGTEEPHGPLVPVWSDACKAAGWKFDSKTHPGGHHFPENWDVMQPEIAGFLQQ